MLDIDDRFPPCAIVAGASSGIGRAIATALLEQGWEVALLARRLAPLEALAERAPSRALPLSADVGEVFAVEQAARRLQSWRPRFSALVMAVGDFFARPIEATTPAEFQRLWNVNVFSKFLLLRELLPALAPGAQEAPPSAVVHVASLAAHYDFSNESAYAAAMYAVRGMARSQDIELRPRRIRVTVLSPGLVRTELTERNFPESALREALTPEAIAGTALHLIATIRAGGYIPEILHIPG